MPNDPTTGNTIAPLPANLAVVDQRGFPTQYFIRWAQQRSIDISQGITYAQLIEVLAEISIIAGTGLTGGGPIDDNVTLDLADTAVEPGEYTNANITVDQQGRITAAADGSAGTIEVTDGTTDVHSVTKLLISGAVVSNPATGEAEIAITPASALEVDDAAGTVATEVTKLKFTGADVTVTSDAAGEAHVDVTVPTPPTFDLVVRDEAGVVGSNVSTLEFTGADVTVTQPVAGTVHIDVTVPTPTPQIWAPVVSGDLPGPVLIANEDGSCMMVEIS